MTQQTQTAQPRRRSPLWGLLAGVVVVTILFPGVAATVFHTIVGIICFLIGAVIAATVLSLSSMRG